MCLCQKTISGSTCSNQVTNLGSSFAEFSGEFIPHGCQSWKKTLLQQPFMSHNMRTRIFWHMGQRKTRISLQIHAVWSVFIVHMKQICIDYPKYAQWRFWSDCINTKADLNLGWAYMPEGKYSDIVAHIMCSTHTHPHHPTPPPMFPNCMYHIYPKYWDTLSTYHTCPKIWNTYSPFYYLLLGLKHCCMYGKQCRHDQMPHFAASDLGLHCLERPSCPNT